MQPHFSQVFYASEFKRILLGLGNRRSILLSYERMPKKRFFNKNIEYKLARFA
jgi:hypothetical protein